MPQGLRLPSLPPASASPPLPPSLFGPPPAPPPEGAAPAPATPAPRSLTMQEMIRQEADKAGVPWQLALAVAEQESSFNPHALGPKLPSGARAIGTFQLLPETARTLGVDENDPHDNIVGGVKYLRQLLDRYQGDPNQALKAYGGVVRDTTYVPSVLARMQKYGGQPSTPAGPPPPPWYTPEGLLQTAEDLGTGALKGLGQTATNLGRLPHLIPGVSQAVDWLYGTPGLSSQAFDAADTELAPSNTTQKVGKVGEQLGELLIPGGAIEKAGSTLTGQVAPKLAPYVGKTVAKLAPRVATEAAAGAGMAAAHGESAQEGALFGAAVPVAAAVAKPVAKYLLGSAEKKVAQAFGPTKEKFKAIIRKRTPEILQRGLSGSREGLLELAEGKVDEVGQAVDDALSLVGNQPVDPSRIINALEDAKDRFRTLVKGTPVHAPPQYVVLDPRPIRILSHLQQKLAALGPNATIDQLVQARRVWDGVVGAAGGFAHRAPGALGLSLREQSEAWAKREATNEIRALLADETPDLAKVNREFSFWKDIRDTLKQTVERTAPQGPGLGQQLVTGTARVAGAAVTPGGVSSRVGGAYLSGKIAQHLNAILTSPRVRLFDARQRYRLAQAIVNEDTSTIARIAAQVGVALHGAAETPAPSPRVGTPPPAPPKR
jgi:hypothetical protein